MDVNVASQGGQNVYNYADSSVGKIQSIETGSVNQFSDEYVEKNKNDMVSVKDAKTAVDKLNKLLEGKPTHIEYEEDKTFKQVMIMKVVDNNTHEVVNQIPSKQILDMVTQFCEMAGLIVDKKA